MKKTRSFKQDGEWEHWEYDSDTDSVTLDDEGGGFGLGFDHLEALYLWTKKQHEKYVKTLPR